MQRSNGAAARSCGEDNEGVLVPLGYMRFAYTIRLRGQHVTGILNRMVQRAFTLH